MATELNIVHQRVARIESMLAYLMGTMETETVVQPTTEQAKALVAIGQSPWQRMKRATNRYELWAEGWERRIKAQADKGAAATSTPAPAAVAPKETTSTGENRG